MALKLKTLSGLVNAALHIKTTGGIVPVNLHAKTAGGIELLSGANATGIDPITLSVAPTAFYSVGRLSSYSGPVLEADGTTDVAFVGNKLPDMSGAVSKLYDQSGNGHHATQTTSANRPLIHSTGKIGAIQALTFDGANNVITPRTREMLLPTSLVLPTKNSTMIYVGRNSTGAAASTIASLANADGVSVDVTLYQVLNGLAIKGSAANQTMTVYPPVQPAVMCISSDASNSRFYQQNRLQNRTAITGAVNCAGGRIGNGSTAQQRGAFQMLALAVFTPALTAGEINTVMGEMAAAFGISTTFDAQVVLDGDSNMEGTGSSLCLNTSTQLQSLLSRPVQLHNIGVFGGSLGVIATQGATRITSVSGWTLNAPAKKVYYQGAGTNDVIGGRTTSEILADIQTSINLATGAGYQYIVATIPIASTITGPKEVVRQEVNAYLLANYAAMGAARVVDIAGDPRLQDTNDGVHWSDGLHFNNAGRAVVAELIAPAVNALI